jgi:tetratricopeptide (TPR) repeat protein
MPSFSIAFAVMAIYSFVTFISPPPAYSANNELDRVQRLLQAGRMQEALKTVDAYLNEHPNDAQGLFDKGIILAQMAQSEQAIAIFKRLTKDYPELPEPYNNLAVLYSAQGKFEEARQVLLTAIKAHPTYATAHENLGDVYVNLAGLSYGRALQLDRQNSKLQTKLAMINDLSAPNQTSQRAQALSLAASQGTASTPTSNTKNVTVSLPQKDESNLILSTIDAWARAWSAKDANTYLSFYADDFKPSPKMSRKTWEAARRRRIAKPRMISVTIDEPKIEFVESTDAHVTFRQTYRSDTYHDQVRKRLQLYKQGDQWLIYREQVIGK